MKTFLVQFLLETLSSAAYVIGFLLAAILVGLLVALAYCLLCAGGCPAFCACLAEKQDEEEVRWELLNYPLYHYRDFLKLQINAEAYILHF